MANAPVRLALAGPMGAGKSTVGRLLAERWGVPFVDLDAAIGDIPALFAAVGEAGFRRRESDVLAEVVRRDGVLALGGGTVLDPRNLQLLAPWRIVVLMGAPATLRTRVGDGRGRPLAESLEALLAARAAAYRAAGPWVDTDGRDPGAVADQVEVLCGSR